MKVQSFDFSQESITAMEPMQFYSRSKYKDSLTEIASKLIEESKNFQDSVPIGLRKPLVEFTRELNSYYSNLIEGHKTRLIEIEQALKYPNEYEKGKIPDNDVVLAHIDLQKWIDNGNLKGCATTVNNIKAIHRKFFEYLPEEALTIKYDNSNKVEIMIPGEFRNSFAHVGEFIAIKPDSIPEFMRRFDQVYSNLDKMNSLISIAVAHHRFLLIHPFPDGNGRVARLLTQKMLQDSLKIEPIWSLSRGLSLKKREYFSLLNQCNSIRRGGSDGTGNLSEEAMHKITNFFFDVCLSQIHFVKENIEPKLLFKRIKQWCNEENLPKMSFCVLKTLANEGRLKKSKIKEKIKFSKGQYKKTIAALQDEGVVISEHKNGPFELKITYSIAQNWIPKLVPYIDDF